MNAAPAISTAIRMTTVTPWPRAMNVAAVAEPSAARTKNCQGLIEVSELIVQAIFEILIHCGSPFRPELAGRRLARPADGGKTDHDDAGSADEVRDHPRQP